MSSKTKIVVLRMKEIIYTAIFVGLAILLITLFLIMFKPKRDAVQTSADSVSYIPGVYTVSLNLSNQEVDVQVTVDTDRIKAVSLVPLNDSVTTMYPLLQPTLQELSAQIVNSQSTENLTYASDSKYTSTVLIQAVDKALNKAKP